MKKRANRLLCVLLSALLLLSLLPTAALAEGEAGETEAIRLLYENTEFTKISNPAAGSKEPDGINTNDLTGFEANRLNSYAWAVASRGDYIYIGTNRTLFGSALNAVAEQMQNENLTAEKMGRMVEALTCGDVPVNLAEEDYIPQIIKFNVKNNTTEVIYQPRTERGEDGLLYYADKDGAILPKADVASETASFRSVIEFKGNLYFGSLGANMLQLVRVDEEDNAEVVFQTIGLVSSLRACCKYGEGEDETIYFGGQDTTYLPWLAYRMDPANAGDNVLPIVIRSLDPATAGTDNEDWSGIIADFRDFGQYARATVYASGGGNVWDLCSFNGKMYLILAYDRGWALFRGENVGKGEPGANEFGWKWTEIVGDDSIYDYPLAMDEEVGALNTQYAAAYGCKEFAPSLTGTGLLESTATPYVYNGKMYIGSFDNATTIQSQTVIKALVKLQCMTGYKDTGIAGPSLSQIFAPIYEVLSHPQHVWVMDENEQITAVDSANELLNGTTNDYVWRFVEHDGKLYTGTFDSSTAFNYFLFSSMDQLCNLLKDNGVELPAEYTALQDGSYGAALAEAFAAAKTRGMKQNASSLALEDAAILACATAQRFMNGTASVEDLLADMTVLQDARDVLPGEDDPSEEPIAPWIPADVLALVDQLLGLFDVEGLRYWAKARALVENADQGFDIFVTEDGETWDAIVRDGLNDPYNYGARTFTICSGELYVGTANPYYGAQLWKIAEHVHDWDEPVYAWAEDYSEVTASHVCKAYETHLETETASATYEVTKEATYTEEGEITYTATFANPVFETQIEKVSLPKLDLPCDGSAVCPGKVFSDMPAKYTWAHDPIDWAVVNGVTAGTSATTFSPDAGCTRAQVVTFLWRAAGSPEPADAVNPFADVTESAYYYKAVLWAMENEITSGTAADKFSPDETCTRAQIVTFLWRYAGAPVPTSAINLFADVPAGAYFEKAVVWASKAGVTEGVTATAFDPDAGCTRAQVVTFLYRGFAG